MKRHALGAAAVACALRVLACGSDEDASIPAADGGAFGIDSATSHTTATANRDAEVVVPLPEKEAGVDAAEYAEPDAGIDAGYDADIDADAGHDADAGLQPKDCKFGTTFEGLCFCTKDTFVQPTTGVCGATPPGTCKDQGGACTRGFGPCPDAGVLTSTPGDLTCGTLVAVRCCSVTCAGPSDFVCCPGPDAGTDPSPPICENGFRTCTPDRKPVSGTVCPP